MAGFTLAGLARPTVASRWLELGKKRARRVPLHGGHCFLSYPNPPLSGGDETNHGGLAGDFNSKRSHGRYSSARIGAYQFAASQPPWQQLLGDAIGIGGS